MKALVAGCFSSECGSATAGDLLAAELVCDWLDEFGCPYDIAVSHPFHTRIGSISLDLAIPENYTHFIYVCGPFGNRPGEADLLDRFSNCYTMGIDLTMLEPLHEWNPFDVLLERNSSECTRPDITFLSQQPLVPVVGVCLVESYGAPFEELAYTAIKRLIASRQMAVVQIDTRLDCNSTKLRSSAEIESVLARMDLVITTRLHGTVLSLKNGVPTISIDPEGDALKVKRQADMIGWPMVFKASEVDDKNLRKAFDYCLTQEAKLKARECSEVARKVVEEIRNEFLDSLATHDTREHNDFDNLSSHTGLNRNLRTSFTDRIYADLKVDLSWEKPPIENLSLKKTLRKRLKSILFLS